MTLSTFVALTGIVALGVWLLTTARVPMRPVRCWLAKADRVALLGDPERDADTGPWVAIIDGEEQGECARLGDALAMVSRSHRVRAWAHEMLSCPYCCAGWVSSATVGAWCVLFAGWSGVVWWPAVWVAGGSFVARVMR